MISNFDKCSLLVPMDGANDGTVFTDWSPNKNVITAAGGAKTSTTQSKYYGSSGYFDGSGDALTILSSALFGMGTGDFTVGGWVYCASWASYVLIDFRPSASAVPWALAVTSDGAVEAYDGSSSRTYGSMSTSTWTHVEWGRASGTNTIWINGESAGTWSGSAPDFQSTRQITIGAGPTLGQAFAGYLQDFYVFKGVALHTSTFTPEKMIKTISNSGSGVAAVLDDTGTAAVRDVIAVQRDGLGCRKTTTDASGRFSVSVPDVKHDVLFLDDAAGTAYSDILVSNVTPT